MVRKYIALVSILALGLFSLLGCAVSGTVDDSLATPFTGSDSDQVYRAFVRTRGSLSPEKNVYFYWSGSIYARASDPQSLVHAGPIQTPILKFEGFNVARFERHESGVRMLSREVSFYKDLDGNIIDCWTNPWTKEKNSVLHVYNDPVNFQLSAPQHTQMGDYLAWSIDVNLAYPSPLSVQEYPRYSASDVYRSTEMFDFFALKSDLEESKSHPVPVHMTWTRIGQFLPWMQMGQNTGELVYHIQGYKVLEGFEGLPEALKKTVKARAPSFEFAPDEFQKPNATSWRYFKQQKDAGQYQDKCEP